MTRKDRIINKYFEWLCDFVCYRRFSIGKSYRKVLTLLHKIEFVSMIPMDENRAEDGLDLRWRFVCDFPEFSDARDYITGPCSMLEMMIALALRCEETIMDDTRYGNRTSQWFWTMMTNLGIGSMYDDNFDKSHVMYCVDRFMNRDYESDGKGGLFWIRNCDEDLRDVEIWTQLSWYLNTIIGY